MLEILFVAIPFIFMFVAGVAIPMLLVLSYARFGVGLALVFGIAIVDALSLGEGGVNFGINLYYADIVLGLISIVAGLRLFFARDFPTKNKAWFIFCSVIMISLITGLASFGLTAGVQSRGYFYFMVAGIYAMSFEMNEARLRLVFNAMAASAFLLVSLAVYRWIVYYTPIRSLLPASGSYNVDGPIRVIYSNHALLIAQVLLSGLFFFKSARGFAIARALSPFLLGAVVALQHRSVWLATLVGVMARLLLGNSKSGSAITQLFFLAAIVGVTALPMVLSDKLAGVTEQVGSSASRALAGKDTTGERLQSWHEITKKWYGAGPRSIAIGQSFGADNTRYVQDARGASHKITYIAHNLYVQTLFNTGLFGLIAFLACVWYVVVGLYRICRDGTGGAEAEVLLMLVVMQLAYYVPYGVDYLQSFIFGIAVAYVAGKKVMKNAVGVPPTIRMAA